jgi:putative endonuclease
MHFVYIVRCADGTLYTGYTRDLARRERAHNTPGGRGARYTAGRRPVRLVHVERFRSIGAALRREYQLKRWKRAKKEALIADSRRPRARRPAILEPPHP